MRIWHPIPPICLDTKHLVAEHQELHTILNVLRDGRKGWRNHPETKRWEGHLSELSRRHRLLVEEAGRRGLPMGNNHRTPVDIEEGDNWPDTWEAVAEMREKLARKQEKR